jgi:hypothetical protein
VLEKNHDCYILKGKCKCTPRRRWEDNIKMVLQEVGPGGIDWIELAQDRDKRWALVNAVMKLSGSLKCREFLD